MNSKGKLMHKGFAKLLRSEQGLTLTELVIAAASFAIVSLAAFAVLSSSQRSSMMNDEIVKIQQNVRLGMDIMARDIRMIGYGNPAANSLPCPNGANINHINATDKKLGADDGPDSISMYTVESQIGTLACPFPCPGSPANQISVNGASDLLANQMITLEGVLNSQVTNPGAAGATRTVTLANTVTAPASFPAGTPVLRLACVTYTVTDGTVTPPYQLMRATFGGAAVPIVDGIESLQLAYAVDTDNDGVIDNQAGGTANFDCLDFVPNNGACTDGTTVYAAGTGTVTAIPATVNATPTAVRQVRVTLVGRAIPPQAINVANNTWKDTAFTGSSQVTAEDQVIASLAGIRRRALTRVVSLRDVGN